MREASAQSTHAWGPRESRKLRWSVRIGVALAAIAAAAIGVASPSAADLEITKFAFTPKEITIAPGTRVTWTNRDETPHTVTATDKSFASKGMDTGDRFQHTFDREGDFAYLCTVHPFMTGVVHVRKP
jgi:plastocyanin